KTQELPPRTITCDRLVLAAGTMGSSYLLLRNAERLRGLSATHLGKRFSGNGDMLALVTMCSRTLDATHGPTITHALRKNDALDTGSPSDGRGVYLEDGGFPAELAWAVENISPLGVLARVLRFVKQLPGKLLGRDTDTDLGKELSDLLGEAELSSRTLPLLAMGRDVP